MEGKSLDIVFYILPSVEEQERLRFACQLSDEIWQQNQRLCIQVNSLEQANRLDTLLWVAKQESFLAHDFASEKNSSAPILINYNFESTCNHLEILINLSQQPPPYYDKFARLIEIVDNDPTYREAGRERYRFYRHAGYTPATYELNRKLQRKRIK